MKLRRRHFLGAAGAGLATACGRLDLSGLPPVPAGDDFTTEAAVLKACINENFKFIAERAVQIHGGIGTSREHNIGLFYRRAKSWETVCGDSDLQYDLIVDSLAANV